MLSNDDLFIISSLFKSLDINDLLLVNSSPDLFQIEEQAFIPHLIIEFREILFDIHPITFSYHVSTAFSISFINGLTSSIKTTFKTSNNDTSSEPYFVFDNSIDFITNINIALNEKE